MPCKAVDGCAAVMVVAIHQTFSAKALAITTRGSGVASFRARRSAHSPQTSGMSACRTSSFGSVNWLSTCVLNASAMRNNSAA